ncbi:hypothetical protein [Amycolatopsis sp. NPDC059657]|uniref:hypothetical protein n=1 Tax=Amycolatopsis sp. NPDC059657 TaxID=3346899 RepID=UPI00366B43DF
MLNGLFIEYEVTITTSVRPGSSGTLPSEHAIAFSRDNAQRSDGAARCADKKRIGNFLDLALLIEKFAAPLDVPSGQRRPRSEHPQLSGYRPNRIEATVDDVLEQEGLAMVLRFRVDQAQHVGDLNERATQQTHRRFSRQPC